MALQPGEIIDGKYRIIREIGAGSMGAVYEGENVRIHRRVAIKVLLPAVAERGDVVQRFEREAQAAGRIGSDHIVEVLDLGTMADGGFYMVMEFLEGHTLGDRLRKSGRIPPRELVPLMQQLLFGLEMAHDARIIHRDLKPDNIFVVREHAGQRDFVKILDFGISKFNPLNADEGMSMTRTGTVMGTPFYMAPEQAKGAKEIDARSDLYSVGVILYEAVTGQRPFHAGTFNELIFKIVLETPPPPEHFVPDLDPAFSRVIRRAMAREPEQRFATAAAFRDALSVWLHTGRGDEENLTAPPGQSGDDNMATRMVDAPEASTQIFDGQTGGGTALVLPDEPAARPAPPRNPERRTEPLPAYASQGNGVAIPKGLPVPQGMPSDQGVPGAQSIPGVQSIPVTQAMPATHAVPGTQALPIPEGMPVPQGTPLGMQRLSDRPLAAHMPTPVGRTAPVFPEEPVAAVAGVPGKRSAVPLIIGGSIFLVVGAVAAGIFLLPGESEADAPHSEARADDEGDREPSTDGEDDSESTASRDDDGSGDDSEERTEESSDDGDGSEDGDAEPLAADEPAGEPPPESPPPKVAKTPPSPPPVAPRPTPKTVRPNPKPQPPPAPKPEPGGRRIKTEL